MAGLITFDLKAHRKAVLMGRIKGPSLLGQVRRVTTHPEVFASPENLAQANSFLLWHLAFSPDKADRDALFSSGVTSEFESRARGERTFLEASVQALLPDAIPGSFTRRSVGRENTTWLPELFDQVEVDWKVSGEVKSGEVRMAVCDRMRRLKVLKVPDLVDFTDFGRLIGAKKLPGETDFAYLVRRSKEKSLTLKGLPLALTAQIPGYERFRLKPEEQRDRVLFNHLRLAVSARYRTIMSEEAGQEPRDLLDILPSGEAGGFSHNKDQSDQCFLFPGKMRGCKYLTAILVKNEWVIGYAMATQYNRQALDGLLVGVNVFREFRGTKSSARIFNLFLGALPHVVSEARKAVIYFGDPTGTPGEAEDQRHSTIFYMSNGFAWSGPDQMVRKLPECQKA